MKRKLSLTILTPEKTVLADEEVDFVSIPAVGGEMGVLPGHIPFVVQLKEGVLRYKEGYKREAFAVFSGFAEIYRDKVLILAEAAELSKEIDEERSRQAYQKAREALVMRGKDMDMDSAQAALRRASVRLKIAEFKKKHKHGV